MGRTASFDLSDASRKFFSFQITVRSVSCSPQNIHAAAFKIADVCTLATALHADGPCSALFAENCTLAGALGPRVADIRRYSPKS